jgi:hypothetical protein
MASVCCVGGRFERVKAALSIANYSNQGFFMLTSAGAGIALTPRMYFPWARGSVLVSKRVIVLKIKRKGGSLK